MYYIYIYIKKITLSSIGRSPFNKKYKRLDFLDYLDFLDFVEHFIRKCGTNNKGMADF